jgi:hypothetical protein
MPPEIVGYQSIQKIGTEQISYYDRGEGAPAVLIHGMLGAFLIGSLCWNRLRHPIA